MKTGPGSDRVEYLGSKAEVGVDTWAASVNYASYTHELNILIECARLGKAAGAQDLEHMDGAAAAFNYIRIANLIPPLLDREGAISPVLDWGCGYGQVSWLLRRRGVPVFSYDVEKRPARERMAPLNSVDVRYGADPVRLPYQSLSLGAVLSVGVLEHVSDIGGSLREINRVLQVGGLFFIFMLPNRYSWAEWIADRRHRSVHPVKFTFGNAASLLSAHGFDLERGWRRNLLPRNLTGLGQHLKTAYGSIYPQIEFVDRLLANIPPVSFFSGVLEFIARKRRPLDTDEGPPARKGLSGCSSGTDPNPCVA